VLGVHFLCSALSGQKLTSTHAFSSAIPESSKLTVPKTKRFAVLLSSLALIFVVLGVGGALAWQKYKTIVAASQQPPPPEMPEPITLVKCSEMTYRSTVTAIGTIRAPRSITLRNEIAGQVVEVPLQAGQIVEKGQTLLVLDRSVDDAMLRSAVARQRMAKSMLERTRRVASANASSGNEIDQSEAEMAQADAEVARLTAIIDKKTLLAPFRAKAGLLNTHVGQYLSEGTEITSLQGIDDHIHIDFMMPQVVADSVQIGDKVRLMTSPEPLWAEVIAFDSMADRSTRNLMARAQLNNPPPHLQPNDSIKVEIAYGPDRRGIAIPAEALRRSPTDVFVFVAELETSDQLRAHARPVFPGQTIGNSVVIGTGLSANDQVIVDGSFKLRDGALVVDSAAASDPVAKRPVAGEPVADSVNASAGS
jgi:membrane fusion protein, multidrug efflux system